MTDLDPKQQHQFWNTQPVLQINENPVQQGPIDAEASVERTRHTPYPLAPGFSWSVIDTQNEEQRIELYDFLCTHYVIHPQNTFRFAYSPEFLNWALHPPGWKREWHLGVRSDKTGKLAAFISALPITVRVRDVVMPIVAVDFLSVHQSIRGKNLAPLMIKEITRRVNVEGIFQAIYTAGKLITQPITKAQYYHRLISYEKLVKVKFTSLRPGENLQKLTRQHQLSSDLANLPGFRPMEPKDVPEVTRKLNEFLTKYVMSQVFSEEEVAHNFLPKPKIIGSYVIERKGEIEDFFSFYIVPSTVLDCPEYDSYTAAYIYYYFARPSHFSDLAKAAMSMASSEYGADVMNCLDVCDNKEILSSLRFVPGDGSLHYYLFNYAVEPFKQNQCGVVLL